MIRYPWKNYFKLLSTHTYTYTHIHTHTHTNIHTTKLRDLETEMDKSESARRAFEKRLRTSEEEKGGLLERNADLLGEMHQVRVVLCVGLLLFYRLHGGIPIILSYKFTVFKTNS